MTHGSSFTIFGPGDRRSQGGTSVGGGFPRRAAVLETSASARELAGELEQTRRHLDAIKDEPLLVAQVVEIRDERMLVSMGPQIIDIHRIDGATVGSRVRLHRQSSQAVDVIDGENADDSGNDGDDSARMAIPIGSIVSVARCSDGIVEAEVMNLLRSFRAPAGVTYEKGERVVVDPSLAYVIGSLGMPPQTFAHAPAFSVSWSDVGGHEHAKAALREALELPFSHPELFAAYGKHNVAGVILSGPSGCGKTLLAKAAATAIARAHGKSATAGGFVYVKGPELLNAYIGRTEEAIRRLFSAAREHKKAHGYPAVIFLDECDAILGVRDHTSKLSINATTVPQFLAEMDGLDDRAAMLILATNRPDMLDPAITREGRIDRRVHVDRPSQKDAGDIAAIHLAKRPLAAGLVLDATATHIAEHVFDPTRLIDGPLTLASFVSGAMIAGIVEQATTAAMMRDIATGAQKASGIELADLDYAITQAQTALAHTNHSEAILEFTKKAT